MRYLFLVGVIFCIPIFSGCSPTFNWRDVHPEQTPLTALFPCKPDKTVRTLSLGSREVSMTMLGCNAGDATFALAFADVKNAAEAAVALGQWRSATLANLRVQSSSELPFLIPGASVSPPSVQVQARGARADGSPVVAQAAWFAAGSVVFQAVVYADKLSPAAVDTYFSGLRLQ